MRMKKTLSVILLCVLLAAIVSVTVLPASAEKVRTLLVAGDAISAGSGLDDRVGKCYGSLIASYYGLSGKYFKNISEDAATSDSLLENLKFYENEIISADTMIISIGTNDIMNIIMGAFEATVSGKVSYGTLIEYSQNSEFMKNLDAAMDYQAIMNASVKLAYNIDNIVSDIRGYNPDIRIAFLSLYNPVDGTEALKPLATLMSNPLTIMNDALVKSAADNKCDLIDVQDIFTGNSVKMTNITSLDVAPNAVGHKAISERIIEYIEALPELAPETTAQVTISESQTAATPETKTDETTVSEPLDIKKTEEKSRATFYIVVAVVVAGAGVAIGVISAVNKSKKNSK